MTDQLQLTGSPRRICTISDCHQYRYELGEFWDDLLPFDTWILCNPSTADASKDDPTVRKVRGFAKRWGRGGWVIVNVFALRSTDPSELTRSLGPFTREGVRNPLFLGLWAGKAAKSGGRIILGWGGALPKLLRADAYRVASSLGGNKPWCLGTTSDGQPRHPLMLAYSTGLQPWIPR